MRKRLCRQGRVPTVETYIAEVREGKWDNVGYDMTGEFPLGYLGMILISQRILQKLVHQSVASKTRNPRVLIEHLETSQHRTMPTEPKRQLSVDRSLSRLSLPRQSVPIWKRSVQFMQSMSELIMVDVLPDQGILTFSHNGAFAQKAILPGCLGTVQRGHGSGGCIEETQQHQGASLRRNILRRLLICRLIHSPSTSESTRRQSLAVYG
jgi:hypothetical protein